MMVVVALTINVTCRQNCFVVTLAVTGDGSGSFLTVFQPENEKSLFLIAITLNADSVAAKVSLELVLTI